METDNRSSYFNGAEIREKIKELIGRSESSIQVAMAWFTDPEIFEAIEQALDRGVRVSLVIGENEDNDRLPFHQLESKGATVVRIAGRGRGVMHNKFAIIDDKYVLNGSYNWTLNAATNNSENMHISQDNQTIKEYKENFDHIMNNDTGAPQENVKDVIRNIENRRDDKGQNLAERFHAAMRELVYAHFNGQADQNFTEFGLERARFYKGDPPCVVAELDGIQGHLVQNVDENHKTLLLAELDNKQQLYQTDVDKRIDIEKKKIERLTEIEIENLKSRISEKHDRINVIDSEMSGLKSSLKQQDEKIKRERLRLIDIDEEYSLNDVNWLKFGLTMGFSALLLVYLFIFYSSAFYILLYSATDLEIAQMRGDELAAPGIFDYKAWAKAFEKGDGAPIFLGMGVVIPLFLATCAMYVRPKWLGETMTYLFGILGFDFFVAWRVSKANFDVDLASGKASSAEAVWEFSDLFADSNFYLVFIMGAMGLFFFKHMVSMAYDTYSQKLPKYQNKIKRLKQEPILNEIEDLEAQKSKCNASFDELEDEKRRCERSIDENRKMILESTAELENDSVELTNGSRGIKETISNIAENYRVQITAGNMNHQWRMVSAFYADFMNGWNQYLFGQYAARVAGEMQAETQKLFNDWKDRNYHDGQ